MSPRTRESGVVMGQVGGAGGVRLPPDNQLIGDQLWRLRLRQRMNASAPAPSPSNA